MAEYWVDPTVPGPGTGTEQDPWNTIRNAHDVLANEANTIWCHPGEDLLTGGSLLCYRLAGTTTVRPITRTDTRLLDDTNRALGYTLLQNDWDYLLFMRSGDGAENHVNTIFEGVYFKTNPALAPSSFGSFARFGSTGSSDPFNTMIVFDGCAFIWDKTTSGSGFEHSNTAATGTVIFSSCIVHHVNTASIQFIASSVGTYHFVNSVFNGAGGSRLVDTIADPSADEQNVYNSILRNTSESVVCYRANKVHQCRHVGTISPESDIVGSSQITSAQFDSIFPNWAAGDYRVAADSLLVQDLGVDRSADANGIAHDIIGTARPQGAAWDLGPEEYLSPSQPVDPDNTVTIVGGITDPNSLFADLTGGDTLSWKLSDDSTVTANVTLDAEGYPVFDTADAYDEVEVTYNIQPLGGGWGLPKFWTADLTKVQAADPANKITAVAGITDEKSLFEGLSGGEVVSWTSPTTGVVADVTIDAEGFPVFSNVPEQGGQAVFIYNWESSDGAGDWGSLYSYTAILTPPAAVDPLHTIQARTGITDPKSIFQQDEVAITGNERFSWSDATGDVTADVDIDVDGFPVFSNHSGLGECTFIYNYETSIGAGDWSDAGTYTAELLDPQAVDPNNLHTVTDLTYIDDPECIYHDLTPPTAIGDIFSWQSPTPKDGSTVTIDAQGFPVIDSGGALGMDSFRYNRDVGGQGFWTTPGVWTYELRAGSGPFVDVHVVTDISMANDVNCIYHNADDPGTPLAQVGSVISFMPESEVYDWAVDIDAQGFPVITNDNEYGPDSFRFSVDFDGDDNWDTPITWHFTTINPAATLTNPRVDEDTITTGGAKVYVTSDKAGGVIYAAHRTDRPWYQDEQTDIEMNAFDTVTSVEGENEFTADNLDPVTGYYYGFAQE